ncbi:MAG: hypothetical protein ABJE10_06360 [bacterium]
MTHPNDFLPGALRSAAASTRGTQRLSAVRRCTLAMEAVASATAIRAQMLAVTTPDNASSASYAKSPLSTAVDGRSRDLRAKIGGFSAVVGAF